MAKNKKVRAKAIAHADKRAVARPADQNPFKQPIIVRFNETDREGPWCLSRITPEHHLNLLQFLHKIENMTVQEIFTDGDLGIDYQVADLPSKVARDRLFEIQREDEVRISRLRIQGRPRLYGFRRDPHFHVLWWDPEHEIWPSTLKNT
jgi:hypothetical protein